MRLFQLLKGTLSVLLWSYFTEGRPQSPTDQMGAMAIAVASQAGSVLENGGAMRHEKGIETDYFKVNSKSEAGVGNAMRPPSSYDDDDRRRRKRSPQLEPDHPHQHRGKRSPCHMMPGGGGGTGGGGANDVEEIARRMRAAKRKRAKQAKKAKRAKKSKFASSRRRRQAEDPEGATATLGQKISDQTKVIASKIEETWKSMMQGFEKLGQQIKGAFEKAKEQQMPQDAQLVDDY